MPVTYERVGQEVLDLATEIMREYHGPLSEADVTGDILYAYAPRDEDGEITGPALSHKGYPADAVIRKTTPKDRVKGCRDYEMVIDADRWANLEDEERRALLDHELTHLQLVVRDGAVVFDQAGRPQLKMRPHDREIGWFNAVVMRHRENALEFQAHEIMGKLCQQMKLFAT